MPFLFRNLILKPGEDEGQLSARVAKTLGVKPEELLRFQITRKGVDARKKPRVFFVYTVSFSVADEDSFWKQHRQTPHLEQIPAEIPSTFRRRSADTPVVIVGMGPAGLFCALHTESLQPLSKGGGRLQSGSEMLAGSGRMGRLMQRAMCSLVKAEQVPFRMAS